MNASLEAETLIPEEISKLSSHAELLPESQRSFAKSLHDQWMTHSGQLSQKQWHWVHKLNERMEQGPAVPEPVIEVKIGDVSGILALFKTAASKLKYPRIDLQLADSSKLQLLRAGKGSKEPGTITVTDGKPYGQGNRFYGRIRLDGTFIPHKDVDARELKMVVAVLQQLATDPAGTAAAYGKLTGRCCFCSTGLEDPKSVSVGYGPICAGRWGLPWGKKVCS